jgi:hypothetical protein
MAKMETNDGMGAGKKRVVPVDWQEAVPFALRLEQRWRQGAPAIPERVRYVELDIGAPDRREGFDRVRGNPPRTNDPGDRTILPGFPPYGDDEE